MSQHVWWRGQRNGQGLTCSLSTVPGRGRSGVLRLLCKATWFQRCKDDRRTVHLRINVMWQWFLSFFLSSSSGLSKFLMMLTCSVICLFQIKVELITWKIRVQGVLAVFLLGKVLLHFNLNGLKVISFVHIYFRKCFQVYICVVLLYHLEMSLGNDQIGAEKCYTVQLLRLL